MSPARLPNGRDLGQFRTSDGRLVRPGMLFRSAAPTDPSLVSVLAGLDIGVVYDLRTIGESQHRPDILPDSVRLRAEDMLEDDPDSGPASLGSIARASLAGERPDLSRDELRQAFLTGYRSFVTLGSSRRAAARILTELAEENTRPVLFHCTAGEDRTGWLAALILLTLGVPEEQIMSDYLSSGPAVWEMFAPYAEQLRQSGGDVEMMKVALGVYPEYLRSSFTELHERFGTLDNYLSEGLSLDPAIGAELRARMLIPPTGAP